VRSPEQLALSPELETLDQLLGGAMSLAVIRRLYPDDASFAQSIHALLRAGDVQLISQDVRVPQWRWRELFTEGRVLSDLSQFELDATEPGVRRIA
jgi:hypothetical protein